MYLIAPHEILVTKVWKGHINHPLSLTCHFAYIEIVIKNYATSNIHQQFHKERSSSEQILEAISFISHPSTPRSCPIDVSSFLHHHHSCFKAQILVIPDDMALVSRSCLCGSGLGWIYPWCHSVHRWVSLVLSFWWVWISYVHPYQ